MTRWAYVPLLLASLAIPLPAQIASAHRLPVSALAYDLENRLVVSAGMDGFLGLWDLERKEAVGRFQVSPYALSFLALRPGRSQAAVVESDGYGLFRVSAWDYLEKRKLFTLRFRDPVTALSYSAAGNFLMVGRSARNGVVFVDPEDGALRQAPEAPGPASFVATGRSERTMILYSPQGLLSYWDLESRAELRRLQVLPALSRVRLAANNRYLLGLDDRGLVVVDAQSGSLLGRAEASPGVLLLGSPEDGGDLALLEQMAGAYRLTRLRLSSAALPLRESAFTTQLPGEVRAAAALGTAGYAVAGTDGLVRILDGFGRFETLRVRKSVPIREAASAGQSLSLLGDGYFLTIPSDPSKLMDGTSLAVHSLAGYDRLTAGQSEERGYLLWSTEQARRPLYRRFDGDFVPVAAAATAAYRSVSFHGGRFLALDAAGRLTVFRPDAEVPDFTFSSLALLDAAFLDERRILLARGVLGSTTPFLVVDTLTGETVAGDYPAQAAVRVYRGSSGKLYSAVVVREGGTVKTIILRLDPTDFHASTPMVEYQGEDVGVQLAEWSLSESVRALATSLGGDGAGVYSEGGFAPFDRTDALPQRLLAASGGFAAVDADGALVWYGSTGAAIAQLRLFDETWELQLVDGTGVSGSLSRVDTRIP